jgi:spore coat protein A
MHFHLVNVQVLNRQPFQVSSLGNGKVGQAFANFTGPATPPAANETGWKETIMMFPGTVTRFIAKFSLVGTEIRDAAGNLVNANGIVNGLPPVSQRPFAAGGFEYVWHCHILEHEEHDMMRPLIVT